MVIGFFGVIFLWKSSWLGPWVKAGIKDYEKTYRSVLEIGFSRHLMLILPKRFEVLIWLFGTACFLVVMLIPVGIYITTIPLSLLITPFCFICAYWLMAKLEQTAEKALIKKSQDLINRGLPRMALGLINEYSSYFTESEPLLVLKQSIEKEFPTID